MKKLIVLIGIIALMMSCDRYEAGPHKSMVNAETVTPEVKTIETLIENSNHETERDLDNLAYTVIKENNLFCIVEPDGRLLAVCHSFEKAKEVLYEHSKLIE